MITYTDITGNYTRVFVGTIYIYNSLFDLHLASETRSRFLHGKWGSAIERQTSSSSVCFFPREFLHIYDPGPQKARLCTDIVYIYISLCLQIICMYVV